MACLRIFAIVAVVAIVDTLSLVPTIGTVVLFWVALLFFFFLTIQLFWSFHFRNFRELARHYTPPRGRGGGSKTNTLEQRGKIDENTSGAFGAVHFCPPVPPWGGERGVLDQKLVTHSRNTSPSSPHPGKGGG